LRTIRSNRQELTLFCVEPDRSREEWKPGAGSGVYEGAVQGVRRLVALVAESDEGDVVRDALVGELRVALDLESVRFLTCDEVAAAHDARALTAAVGSGESHRERSLVLELCSPAGAQDAVVLVTREPHGLGADELAAAAALVDVASLVLGLLGARHEAATDELTGCLNRRAGLARFGEEIARAERTRSPVSCLMLDIDNLKRINDSSGHLEGDRVLREVGASLRGQLRAYDLAARYGGDEFLVLLPDTGEHAAAQAATRMRTAVARISSPAEAIAQMPVSVTFGAATSRPGELPDTLLQRADQALLNAKRRTNSRRGGKTQADAES
jgi:diguanylate cyclase (GGDEF)-like protein